MLKTESRAIFAGFRYILEIILGGGANALLDTPLFTFSFSSQLGPVRLPLNLRQ